ncbi:MAG: hypothetical protein ACOH1X_07095 [Kaistella sp.]
MIDYSLFGTYNREAMQLILSKIKDNYFLSVKEKGWEKATIFSNGKGVKLYAHFNKYGECYKIMLAFSPHKQFNNNLHNANYFTYKQAQKQIVKTFEAIGISYELFKEFYISSIEIGINFNVQENAFPILNSALMFGRNYFVTHHKHKHYRFAGDPGKGKYLKTKFYIKSEQRNGECDCNYFELGYCDQNIMRFETKLKRAEKFKFIDFGNLESLYLENSEEILSKQLLREFGKIFFFSVKHIKQNNLTKPQQKKYYQYQVKGFWENLNTRKLNTEKKYFNTEMPKNINLKKELSEIILKHLALKNYVGIPNEIELKSRSKFLAKYLRIYKTEKSISINENELFCLRCTYIGIGKATKFTPCQNQRKRICLITGLDISAQKKGSRFLREKNLKLIKVNSPDLYKPLEKKYLKIENQKESEQRQLYLICKNIRDKDSNARNNRKSFERRNYHKSQLQFSFQF